MRPVVDYEYDDLNYHVPVILVGVFSLCLLLGNLLALWSAWLHLPLGSIWLVNAKDAMVGRITSSGSNRLTWKGHTRSPSCSRVHTVMLVITFAKRFIIPSVILVISAAKHFIMMLLFRRVR